MKPVKKIKSEITELKIKLASLMRESPNDVNYNICREAKKILNEKIQTLEWVIGP